MFSDSALWPVIVLFCSGCCIAYGHWLGLRRNADLAAVAHKHHDDAWELLDRVARVILTREHVHAVTEKCFDCRTTFDSQCMDCFCCWHNWTTNCLCQACVCKENRTWLASQARNTSGD